MPKQGLPSNDKPEASAPTDAGSRRKSKRVTIKHVAEAAGVSIATVSFVLNNRPGQVISEPVKKRVLQVARDMNYAPSAAAAGLARKQTSNVAIAFYRNAHLMTNQLYSFVVQGAIKEASLREYNVLFSFIDDSFVSYDDLPKIIREKNAEGVLFIQDVSADLVSELLRRGVSAVAVDSHPPVAGLDAVYVDNDRGARLAARHLLELGHKKIAYLRAGADRPSIQARSVAFVDELRSALPSADLTNICVDAEELTFHAGYERAKQLLLDRPELTAIACANDELAAGALRAGRELGRNVPQDLSVVGFDDIIMARYLDPPLTTIACDKEGLGRAAMKHLIQQVNAKQQTNKVDTENDKREHEPSSPLAPQILGQDLEVSLVQRGSTAKAPIESSASATAGTTSC